MFDCYPSAHRWTELHAVWQHCKQVRMRLFCLFLVASLPVAAQSRGVELFEKKIRPVLAEKCYGCHSSKLKSPMGGLALDTKAGLQKGGVSGPEVIPQKP